MVIKMLAFLYLIGFVISFIWILKIHLREKDATVEDIVGVFLMSVFFPFLVLWILIDYFWGFADKTVFFKKKE